MSVLVAVAIAFLTALSVELIKTGKEIFIPPRHERLERVKSAVLLAHWLELFASRCLTAGDLTNTYEFTEGHVGEVRGLPELGSIPDSVNLTLFAPKIVSGVCALEIDVEQALNRLLFESRSTDDPDYLELIVRQSYIVGGRAQQLADLIRREEKLLPPALLEAVDYRDSIRDISRKLQMHRSPSQDS